MRRLVLPVLAALCLTAWATAFLISRSQSGTSDLVMPTLMVLPSLTPTDTASPTLTPSLMPTFTSTATLPPTETPVPTLLPTLSERVVEITVVVPGVFIPPAPTDFPYGTTLLSAPPQPVEPLPDATDTAPPFFGWYSFESDYPTVQYSPPWTPRLSQFASRGQYHRTETAFSTASFMFEGEGLRVRYVTAQNMGMFEIVVDGVVLDTIDAYADGLTFPTTAVYFVGDGVHRLEVRAIGRKHNASEGYVVGLDAIHVWRGDANTLIIPPLSITNTPTPSPQPAARIALVGAPPTMQPTGTPIPPRIITAEVVIAYDENGNRTVDPAEGVAGISVRVVEINTNRVIASGFTDARGYVVFEVITDAPAQIVVPYFGRAWTLQRGNNSAAPAYTLLLTPGNQPGLIP
ncbi:hypothetical protein FBR02_13770 [Anaerolineae bacterium CFX9]|nr:hypothetical protein [Anaerolineae bacterium]MDL1901828.1 hypothetical protein [Anaerolineae bacterium CFX9]GIK28173.1 MAG: hypothetical protein BroJett007_13110 [Chloroflexota bacterium]